MYVWNARKLAVRREQTRRGEKAVKMPVHSHSCDGFKPTDKLTLQVVVDQDTEEITRIQVASLGYSFHTFWQCNPRISACLNVEYDEQLVCSYGRTALMLSDCAGSAKHHKFKFVYTMILLIKRWILSCRCSLTLPIAPRQRETSMTFVLVLFLRKRLSGLVARAAYHASGMGRRFAHGRFANTQLPRTCSLTPPSNRLSFTTRSSRRKPRLSRLWFRLLFCWGSLPVVPPLPCRLQRLAAMNCLKFLTA